MRSNCVSVAKIAELLDLKSFTTGLNLKNRKVSISDVNRPALQLAGYFEHFETSRIQIMGNVEYAYIQQMNDEEIANLCITLIHQAKYMLHRLLVTMQNRFVTEGSIKERMYQSRTSYRNASDK